MLQGTEAAVFHCGYCRHKKHTSVPLRIVIEGEDLAKLIKHIRTKAFVMRKEVGVISFNETVLKELLDISVSSIDLIRWAERLLGL